MRGKYEVIAKIICDHFKEFPQPFGSFVGVSVSWMTSRILSRVETVMAINSSLEVHSCFLFTVGLFLRIPCALVMLLFPVFSSNILYTLT